MNHVETNSYKLWRIILISCASTTLIFVTGKARNFEQKPKHSVRSEKND